ncbi:MAG: hypothetical protein IKH16_07690 [Selenomonadaceae bacterium]|nr:hypothetical protein [Selenomonadaceae bacterium]
MKDSGVEIYSYLMKNKEEQAEEKKEEAAEEKKAAGFYKGENRKVTLESFVKMVGDGGK